MDAESLGASLQFNARALDLVLDGITHEDTLVQPPCGNCVNWVLGHILAHRNLMLAALGAEPVWDRGMESRYVRGSEPVRGEGPGVERLGRLREELERSRERLAQALRQASEQDLARPAGSGTVGRQLLFLALHEAYHIGQVGLLRRLGGKEGAVG